MLIQGAIKEMLFLKNRGKRTLKMSSSICAQNQKLRYFQKHKVKLKKLQHQKFGLLDVKKTKLNTNIAEKTIDQQEKL